MTRVVWDNLAERVYSVGIDRGVIYPVGGGSPAVWNGLTAVTDTGDAELKEYYYDGRKALVRIVPSGYKGTIEAITYPDILDELTGAVPHVAGIRTHNSLPREFHMTYRTLLGSAADGTDLGYRIHMLYNLKASFDDIQSKTLGETVEPTPFSWAVTATERFIKNNIPISHLSVDSREIDPTSLSNLEDTLYGTPSTAPSMPDPTLLIP